MKTLSLENIRNVVDKLPRNNDRSFGKRALNMLEKEGLAYIDYPSGGISIRYDEGNYLRVGGFLSSCNDFANKEDVSKAVSLIIAEVTDRAEDIDSEE